jgi:hypothetical protein
VRLEQGHSHNRALRNGVLRSREQSLKPRQGADFIFNRMRRVLDEFGTDFAHSVRLGR